MVARLDDTPANSNTFTSGSMGSLIERGAKGWGDAYWVDLDGARVGVAASTLSLELQAGCKDSSCVNYVRLGVDIAVERDGERALLHVEDLYPARALELLASALDEAAPERVRAAIVATLHQLDPDDPVGHLTRDPVAPMRLFEPLLNALVSPNPRGTMASWANDRFADLLACEHLALAQTHERRARVIVREICVCTDLRSHGQVKLVGEVSVERLDAPDGCASWKSRATLVPPSLSWRDRPEPDEAHVLAAIQAWRDELAGNLAERLARRGGPIMLSEITPQFDL